MVTGASTANLALILIDARKGVIEQTSRHSFIASLLQIPHIIVCVNKMDLVDFREEQFNKVVEQYREFAAKLNVKDIRFVPISALHGDNIVNRSINMDWYQGETLLHTLETIHITNDQNLIDCRFPIQTIIRPHSDEYHDYRGYAGRVAGGVLKPGDKVIVLPSGFSTTIKSIDTYDGPVQEAFPPMSVTITLNDDIDISRGDMIVRENNQPEVQQDIDVMLCWLNNRGPSLNSKYLLRHTTSEVRTVFKEILYKVDINSLHRIEDNKEIKMNEICRVRLRTTKPLLIDPYTRNRQTGSLILIDETTNETVAAGMII
jgi:sulfate adenylyltransferase subunit 1